MTFGMAGDLYHRGKYVAYGIYGPSIGNHVVTCGPKLPYNSQFFFFFFEVVDQNCYITFTHDEV